MAVVNVLVPGSVEDAALLAVPFELYAANGDLIEKGLAAPGRPAHIYVEEQKRVFVRGRLPNGETSQVSVDLTREPNEAVLFADRANPYRWLAWASHLRNLDAVAQSSAVTSRRIGEVWALLWQFKSGKWTAGTLEPKDTMKEDGVRQMVLDLPQHPHLLQVGGSDVAWRLISLPPESQIRVALTRSKNEASEPIDVTVSRAHPTADILMSFMTRGALPELTQSISETAMSALRGKVKDPVSAVIGGYLLLRGGQLEEKREWTDNLANWFEWMADGSIIRAALELQRTKPDVARARLLVLKAISRGLPIFSIGLDVLVETMQMLHRGAEESKEFHQAVVIAKTYQATRYSSSAYLSFYGITPTLPSLERVIGLPDHPMSVPESDSEIQQGPIRAGDDSRFTMARKWKFPPFRAVLGPRSDLDVEFYSGRIGPSTLKELSTHATSLFSGDSAVWTAGSDNLIEAKNLVKRYGGATVVKGISFSVAPGEIFGLLGPNGAGKTTTILMLLGLSDITEGQARVAGYDPVREPLLVKRRVGYLPDQVGFYDNLTAVDNMRYIARLIGLTPWQREQRIKSSLKHVGLADVADKRVSTFSRGMRQRLGLAEILMKEVQIAILDEPTSGLDPLATLELLEVIRNLKRHGVSVLLSSHLLERVQSVCDRVAVFIQGRIVLTGSVAELGRQVLGGGTFVGIEAEGQGLADRLATVPGVRAVETTSTNCFRLLAEGDVRPEAAAAVVAAGGRLLRLSVEEPSLEMIYTRYFQSNEGARHAA
jgi:ABC-2 type transport system ATP-binding protein